MDQLLGRTLGSYELRELLGGGGMGVVYRAVHKTLGRARAVKVLPAQLALDDNFVERFRREATIAAGLRHPNIVLIYDIAQQDGIHYIVMDLVEGRSLREVIESDRPLPFVRSLNVLRQLGAALDHAHAHGVLHRDVKPSNILIGANDQVTLVDFGIARALEASRLTGTGSVAGTAAYMAPEAVTGRGDGPSIDLYALGVVAFELFAGQPPFDGPNTTAIMYAHVHTPPPSPRTFRPDLPATVERVLFRALAKDPLARYPSAESLATALSAGLAQAESEPSTIPISADPVSDGGRGRSAVARGERAVEPPALEPPVALRTPPSGQPVRRGPAVPPRPPTRELPILPGGDPAMALLRRPAVMYAAVGVGAMLFLMLVVGAWALVPSRPDPTPKLVAVATATPVPPTAPPTPTPVPVTPTPGPTQVLQMAREARLAGDLPRALSLLQPLRQLAPAPPGLDEELYQTHLAYGKALLDRGDFDGALTQYGEALNVRANDAAALDGQKQAQLGKQWARMEAAWNTNEDEAIAALEEILKLDPNYRDARQKLYAKLIAKADRLIAAGDRAGALTVLQRALQINPDGPEVRQRIAALRATPTPTNTLYADNFDNPANGRLPKTSNEPNRYQIGYSDGQYIIQRIDPEVVVPTIYIPGSYDNSSIGIDVMVNGPLETRYIVVGCRDTQAPGGLTGYEMSIRPIDGQVLLYRWDSGKIADLGSQANSPAVRRGNQVNRMELICSGSTITAVVNGTQVLTAQDSTYRTGRPWFLAGAYANPRVPFDVRFDNLVITRR